MSDEYEQLIAASVRSLASDEFWCVFHPDGPLEQTASKRFDDPVRLICTALDADWDDLREQGFRLGRIKKSGAALAEETSK